MPYLSNIRVVDLSRLLPGPFCTMLLADMGADVIKVESTMVGDPMRLTPPFAGDESLSFATVNRNKRSIALNYRKPAGKALLHSLIERADIFVETFKPGQAARQGVDYESVRAVNEGVIYCSLSGYGQTGAHAQRSGHDINFLALSGLLDLLRSDGGRPLLPGFQLADLAGGLFATIAILAALVERSSTGRGRRLDVSIWESSVSLPILQLAPFLAGLVPGGAVQDYLTGRLPGYNVYETQDGQYMALGALEPVLWAEFCKALGREDLIPQQLADTEMQAWVTAELAAIFRQRSRQDWEAFFADKDVCCEPVLSLAEVGERAGQLGGHLVELQRPAGRPLRQIGASRALAAESGPASAPPGLGEHTVEILEALGLSAQEIEALRRQKVVATPQDSSRRRIKGLG